MSGSRKDTEEVFCGCRQKSSRVKSSWSSTRYGHLPNSSTSAFWVPYALEKRAVGIDSNSPD